MSRVVRITNHRIQSEGRSLDPAQAVRTLNRAMVKLTGAPDAISAWRQVAGRGDVFGIKANCGGGPNLCSSPVLAEAIVSGLKAAGVKSDDVITWERSNRELERCGYRLNVSRTDTRCFGTDTQGVGYGTDFHQYGKVASLLSRIFEDYCSKLINFPILKDHSLAGIAVGMKNFYGVVHNPNKYHPNRCDPFIAQILALPIVRERNVLTICDTTRVEYDGGPTYVAGRTEELNGVMVSFDPVALDLCGYRILDSLRQKHGLKTLKESGREPAWIQTAGGLGLGKARFEEIEYIEEDLTRL